MLTRHRDRNPNGIVVNFRRDSDEEATRGRAGGGKAGQGLGRALEPRIYTRRAT